MNINEELNRINTFVSHIKTCKEAIRQAIVAQGVVVDQTVPLEYYAGKIALIEGGGGGTVYTVQYVDWNLTVLKSQDVLPGGAVLKPSTDPTREGYRFTGWDGTSDVVNSDLTITAQYEYAPNVAVFTDYQGKIISTQNLQDGEDAVPPTVDWGDVVLDSWEDYTNIQGYRVITPNFHSLNSKTHLEVELTEATGLSPTVYFMIDSGSTRWEFVGGTGSGSNNVPSVPNGTSRTGTFPAFGRQKIKFSLASGASGYLWPGPVLRDTYAASLVKFIDGAHYPSTDTFKGCINLVDVMLLGKTHTSTFEGCTGITSILYPSTATSGLYANLFKDCANLKTLILKPDTVLPLNDLSAFTGCHADLRIYVPADLVDTYRAATNWSTIADKIHEINDLAIYGN